MNNTNYKYKLLEAFGIEIEYMIVNASTLDVSPLCDTILFEKIGDYLSDFENGKITWSNELVNHVIELKCTNPVNTLDNLDQDFHKNIVEINEVLSKHNAVLMPTGAHPWMNPFTETKLWQHEYNEIYNLYNRIFDCRGHGWANLQSTHINISFSNDEEFGRLHAAIRLLLPIIPALTASTPILDGKITGFSDNRLQVYKDNQKKIPSLTGLVIPERAYTYQQYYNQIFEPIVRDITPYDSENVLDHHFLNSRGAIARFDRGAIEIRVIDSQESPKIDIAIADFIIETIKWLTSQPDEHINFQKNIDEKELAEILFSIIKNGENCIITNKEYLSVFQINSDTISAKELWNGILNIVKPNIKKSTLEIIENTLKNGTLSSRIVKNLDGNYSKENIFREYEKLTKCLANNDVY